MCYAKPGPRCSTHVKGQIASTDRRIAKTQQVLADLKEQRNQAAKVLQTARSDGTDDEAASQAAQRAHKKVVNAEHKLLQLQMLRSYRMKQYATTVEGFTVLQQRAKELRQRDPKTAHELYMRASRGALEHDQRKADYIATHGEPNAPLKPGQRASTRPKMQGTFDEDSGWDGYEQMENALVTDSIKDRAHSEWCRLNGRPIEPSEGMKALITMLKNPDLYEQLRKTSNGNEWKPDSDRHDHDARRPGTLFNPDWFANGPAASAALTGHARAR